MGQARCALTSVWTRTDERSAPAPAAADQGNPTRATRVVAAIAATTSIATRSVNVGRGRAVGEAERAMRQSFPAPAKGHHTTMVHKRTTFACGVSSHVRCAPYEERLAHRHSTRE